MLYSIATLGIVTHSYSSDAGTASTSTVPTTSHTSLPATTDAPPRTPSASPKCSSRRCGTQASSPSRSGPRMAASRLCGPRETRQDTDTTLTTCSAGRGTHCSGQWTRGATSPGARSFRHRALLRAIRVPKSRPQLNPWMAVSFLAWRASRQGTDTDSNDTGLDTLPGNLTVS